MDSNTPFLPDDGSMPSFEPQRKKRGCFFYGCLAAIGVSVIGVILLGLGIFFVYRGVNALVKQYAEDIPRAIPVSSLPPDELKTLHDRVAAFQGALEAAKPAAPLVLTSLEINALIAQNPQFKGVVAADLSGDKIRGQVSFPLDRFGFVGKFLNGAATFDVRIDNGLLLVTLDTLEVRGKQVPEEDMSKLRMENLAKNYGKDPKDARQIARIEKIEVKDGKLIITPKVPSETKASDPKAAEESEAKPVDAQPEPAKKAA